jgi:hypothetical protein
LPIMRGKGSHAQRLRPWQLSQCHLWPQLCGAVQLEGHAAHHCLLGQLEDTQQQNPGSREVHGPRPRHERCWLCVSRCTHSFLVIPKIIKRSINIRRLLAFVAAAEKQNHLLSQNCVIHTVTRSPVDPQFMQALAQRFTISEVSGREPVNSDDDLRSCASVLQAGQPFPEYIFSSSGDITTDIDHRSSVTYKLHHGKRSVAFDRGGA